MTHGVCGYVHHGCRCEDCTRAQRDRMRVYRARAIKSSDALDTTPGNQIGPATAPTVRDRGNQEGTS